MRSIHQGQHRARKAFRFHRRPNATCPPRGWETQLRRQLRHASPYVRLWATVLEWALFELYRSRSTKLTTAAIDWLTDVPDERWFGTFSNLCVQLDLPEQRIRDDVAFDLHMGAALLSVGQLAGAA